MYLLGNTYTLLFQNIRRCMCVYVTQQVYFVFNKEGRNYTKDAKKIKIIMIKSESVLRFY
jgi:hypothetical protein